MKSTHKNRHGLISREKFWSEIFGTNQVSADDNSAALLPTDIRLDHCSEDFGEEADYSDSFILSWDVLCRKIMKNSMFVFRCNFTGIQFWSKSLPTMKMAIDMLGLFTTSFLFQKWEFFTCNCIRLQWIIWFF